MIGYFINDDAPGTVEASGNAGFDKDGYLYFFERVQQGSNLNQRITVLDALTDQSIKSWDMVNFYPTTVSKRGDFLGMAWLDSNKIFLKAADDTTFYKTSIIPEDSLMGDTTRSNLRIITDVFPHVWITWSGDISNQREIFVARWKVNTEIDSNIVTGFQPKKHPPSNLIANCKLYQNYPNPFNPTTTIKYQLPQNDDVTLTIYNILGQKVRNLVDRRMEAGYPSIEWDSRDDNGKQVSSGIYVYRLIANDFAQSRKMLLMR